MAMQSISEKYVKLDQREHVLQRSGMYIGSIEEDKYDTWVFDTEENKMVKREVKYVPGLFKIFDEILVNAIDHSTRLKGIKETDQNVNCMKFIKVSIDRDTGVIEVSNDGDGVEVVKHPEHNIYIPELIFGNMLTSSNYDDNVERIIGGTNGVGSKASNIFSEWFEVETVDRVRKLHYVQKFESNMSIANEPKITKYTKKPFTIIRFKPDYQRFKLQSLTKDMYDMFVKRVYDACAVTDNDIAIYFNNQKLEYKNFEKYVDLYIGSKNEHTRVYEQINERWEVVASYNDFNGFDQVSFVNGIWTLRGGKHVEYILNQITKKLTELIVKKNKNANIKPQNIKDNIILFIKSTIVNPTFDSQSKETLTTPVAKFGSKAELSEKFIDKLYKSGIADKILQICEMNNNKDLKKTDGKKKNVIRGIAKLDDANWAGTAKSKECTLILTEGDSGKTMVLAGLSQVGRDRYGVFPLKGKLLNVKDTNAKKISENEEIANLKKILGLETGKDYKTLDDLRYGKIMLMCDSDSVSGDTPLLLRDPSTGFICIRHIDDIGTKEWISRANKKDYNTTNYEVWTENGWTKIVHMMRHRVTKKMYRVLTHTGIVDVTEDHSLVNKEKQKVTPKDCQVGMELLHSFPVCKENSIEIPDNLQSKDLRNVLWPLASQLKIARYQGYKKQELIEKIEQTKIRPQVDIVIDNSIRITEDEAWVMGLFWADGSCGVYKRKYTYKHKDQPRPYTHMCTTYSWYIFNCDRTLLERACSIMNKLYDLHFHIDNYPSNQRNNPNCLPAYKLIVDGNSKTKHLLDKYIQMYYKNDYTKYQHGNKIVPSYILNAPTTIRQRFLEGLWAGDGSGHDLNTLSKRVDIESKISSQTVFTLCKSLGYEVSINHNIKKPKVYRLNITKGHQQDNPLRIKKIIELGETDQYVYDLETENHHFQAGIGQLIVHNTDGHHITGLAFNIFQSLWPSLFKMDNFLTSMLTPIIKVTHIRTKSMLSFYCLSDYENWKKEHEKNNTLKEWKIKYYKGLGTSTNDEAQQYFKDLKIVSYKYGENSDCCIDLAFNKKKADDRKLWLSKYDRNIILDYNKTEVSYEDFINKSLIHFSNYDIERSIPNIMDGLKTSQRKILFGCVKRNLVSDEIRVAQLASYVSEHSCYHHGEASLQGAIIGMAQNFVGSNNINILKPIGQFGSRIHMGKDAGASRYIYTMLEKIATVMFNKDDHGVLKYLDDDGIPVEPEYYVPIIPIVLVNGAIGIGTGFSTNIPCYNPKDIVGILKTMLTNPTEYETSQQLPELVPWYMGFEGTIKKQNDKYVSVGKFSKVSSTKVEVTELPVGFATQDFKEHLEEMLDKDLKQYDSNYTDKKVHFTLHFPNADTLDNYMRIENNGFTKFENDFKLVSSKNLSTTNMYLFNSRGNIQKYDTPQDIIWEYFATRLQYYAERKQYILQGIEQDLVFLYAKIRFIRSVVSDEVKISKMKKTDLEEYLLTNNFPRLNDKYDYILRIPIYNLTTDKVTELENEISKAEGVLKEVQDKSEKSMWLDELDAFIKEYNVYLATYETSQCNESKCVKKGLRKKS